MIVEVLLGGMIVMEWLIVVVVICNLGVVVVSGIDDNVIVEGEVV